MDLEQQVKQLRTRINALRAKLELNTDNTTTTSVSEPEPSAAELYKARLLKKSS